MKADTPPFHDCMGFIHHALHLLKIPAPYDDHYQESYFVFLKSIEKYDSSRSSFSTYFVYQLLHHFRNQIRKERRDQEASFLFLIQNPAIGTDPLHEPLLLFDIHHHSKLNTLERHIFHLGYTGHTVDEMADLVNVSVSTVKRARKKIKGKVEKSNCL